MSKIELMGLWSLKSKQCFEAYPNVKGRADRFVVTQEYAVF